jgi:hypothetical protein
MTILTKMEKIIVEDRTTETPQQALDREVLAAAQLIAGFTIHVTGARPPVGLGALTYVLGMGTARTGADVEEVISLLRKHHASTQEQMLVEAARKANKDEDEDDDEDDAESATDEDDKPKFDA